MNEIFKLVLNF